MVTKLTTFVTAFLLGFSVFAQSSASSAKAGTSSSTPFQQGTSYLSFKIGSPTETYIKKYTAHDDYHGNSYDNSFPLLALVYENGVTDLAGIGYVSLGGEFGYTLGKHSRTDRYWSNLTNQHEYITHSSVADIFHFGVRTNYHFDFHMMTKEPFFEKFDIYAGLGFLFRYERRVYTGEAKSDFDHFQYNDTDYVFDACLGARYFVKDNLGIMMQFGSSLSRFDLGATYKF